MAVHVMLSFWRIVVVLGLGLMVGMLLRWLISQLLGLRVTLMMVLRIVGVLIYRIVSIAWVLALIVSQRLDWQSVHEKVEFFEAGRIVQAVTCSQRVTVHSNISGGLVLSDLDLVAWVFSRESSVHGVVLSKSGALDFVRRVRSSVVRLVVVASKVVSWSGSNSITDGVAGSIGGNRFSDSNLDHVHCGLDGVLAFVEELG
jgi:hypothetical protein